MPVSEGGDPDEAAISDDDHDDSLSVRPISPQILSDDTPYSPETAFDTFAVSDNEILDDKDD